jgi:hypothetical protein
MGHHVATRSSREPDARPARPAGKPAIHKDVPAAKRRPRRDLRPIYAGILVWMGVFGLIWLLE